MSAQMFVALALSLSICMQGVAAEPESRKDGDGNALPAGALIRLGSLRFRHSAPVDVVAFSPDGAWAASYCGSEGHVAVWQASSGALKRKLPLAGVARMALAPGGNLLAVINSTGTFTPEILVECWDVSTGQRVFRVRDEERYAEEAVLAFSADAKRLYFGRSALRCVDVASGRVRYRISVGREGNDSDMETITALAETPGGDTLVTAEGDGTVHLREPSSGKERCRREGSAASHLALADDGSTLALATRDALEISQLPAAGKQVPGVAIPRRRLPPNVRSPVVGIALSHDGKTLLAIDAEGSACLWNVPAGKLLARRVLGPNPLAVAQFDTAGRPLVLTADRSSPGLRVWNVARGEELLAQHDTNGQVTCMAFSPDGATLVTGHDDKALAFWNAGTGQLVSKIRLPECPCQVDFTPDGKSLVVGANGQWWRLLVAPRHGPRLERPGAPAPADGAKLASWRHGWKHRERPVPWRVDGLEACTVTPDGLLVDLHRNGVSVLKVGSGHKLCQQEGSKYFAAALAPNRRTLAVLRDETTVALAELVNPDTPAGATPEPADKQEGPGFLAPPGMRTVLFTDLATWEVPKAEMLPGQPWLLPCLAFAPGGRFVAVGTPRGSILFRDLANNEQVQQLTGHESPVVMMAFSPEGRTLACAYRDTTVLIWDIRELTTRSFPSGLMGPAQSWEDLEKVEAPQAWKAHWALVGSAQTVPFLKARLQPVHRPDLSPLPARIKELDSPGFMVRNRAMKALEQMGQAAEPALREALSKAATLERRRRLELLLARLESARVLHLQQIRAVAVLEQIGSADARALLDTLAAGDPQAPLTVAARAARQRVSGK
jgi:WD40 repeat protein